MNYYEILGIPKDATEEQIKKAFRDKAKKYHPDINPEGEEIFKQITKAYETLIDKKRRKEYDKTLSKQNPIKKKLENFIEKIPDIISKLGKDINISINLSLEEAFNGTIKTIIYERLVRCNFCNSTGITEATTTIKCDRCKGYKYIKIFGVNIPCPKCHKKGYILINPCPKCAGKGFLIVQEQKNIQIPKGIDEKYKLILENAGNENKEDKESGNLIIKVNLKEHSIFKKEGNDLIGTIYITSITKQKKYAYVYNLKNEKIKIKLPDNIQENTVLVLKNEGFKDYKGNIGDMKLIVKKI